MGRIFSSLLHCILHTTYYSIISLRFSGVRCSLNKNFLVRLSTLTRHQSVCKIHQTRGLSETWSFSIPAWTWLSLLYNLDLAPAGARREADRLRAIGGSQSTGGRRTSSRRSVRGSRSVGGSRITGGSNFCVKFLQDCCATLFASLLVV